MRDIKVDEAFLERLEPAAREQVLRVNRQVLAEKGTPEVPKEPAKDPFKIKSRVTALDKEAQARQQYDRTGRRKSPLLY